jgi:hypothetical protein
MGRFFAEERVLVLAPTLVRTRTRHRWQLQTKHACTSANRLRSPYECAGHFLDGHARREQVPKMCVVGRCPAAAIVRDPEQPRVRRNRACGSRRREQRPDLGACKTAFVSLPDNRVLFGEPASALAHRHETQLARSQRHCRTRPAQGHGDLAKVVAARQRETQMLVLRRGVRTRRGRGEPEPAAATPDCLDRPADPNRNFGGRNPCGGSSPDEPVFPLRPRPTPRSRRKLETATTRVNRVGAAADLRRDLGAADTCSLEPAQQHVLASSPPSCHQARLPADTPCTSSQRNPSALNRPQTVVSDECTAVRERHGARSSNCNTRRRSGARVSDVALVSDPVNAKKTGTDPLRVTRPIPPARAGETVEHRSPRGRSRTRTGSGSRSAADLYRPKEFDQSREHAAVIVGAPDGGVTEQGAGIYAQNTALRGFVALTVNPS